MSTLLQVLTHRQTEHSLALGYLAAMPYKRSLAVMASLREKFANKYRKMEVALILIIMIVVCFILLNWEYLNTYLNAAS